MFLFCSCLWFVMYVCDKQLVSCIYMQWIIDTFLVLVVFYDYRLIYGVTTKTKIDVIGNIVCLPLLFVLCY